MNIPLKLQLKVAFCNPDSMGSSAKPLVSQLQCKRDRYLSGRSQRGKTQPQKLALSATFLGHLEGGAAGPLWTKLWGKLTK
jgi:hypothetical protein